MIRSILFAAALTGVFCAGFTVIVDAVTDALPMRVAIGLAFVSGFLGSLFARFVTRDRP